MSELKAIAAPSYNTNKRKNTFTLKDNGKEPRANVYRVLPPFGNMAADGRWANFETVHWGYEGTKGARMFRCIEKKDYKSGMIRVRCPECERIAEVKSIYDTQLKELVGKGMPTTDAKEHLRPLSDFLYKHNVDKKWWLNVKSETGEIGRLKIPHKSYQALQQVIADLLKKKIDPIAIDKGVWLQFERTGKGRDTQHRVVVQTESFLLDGQPVERTKLAPLTQEDLQKMQTEAFELDDMFRTLTSDEIKRLVASGGDKDVVDDLFASPEGRGAGSVDHFDDNRDDETPNMLTTMLATAPVLGPPAQLPQNHLMIVNTPAPTTPQPSVDAKKAALLAQLAALEAESQPAPAATPPAPQRDAILPKDTTQMSDDEFFAAYGLKK